MRELDMETTYLTYCIYFERKAGRGLIYLGPDPSIDIFLLPHS